jgi:hypothetical protein
LRGSCLCGSVAFEADPPLRDILACHCTQCRHVSGHYWAATSVPHARFRLTRDDGLVWYRSSDQARRGFCGHCGSPLFWQPEGEDRISISAGAFDDPLPVRVAAHWFAEDAGDYYSPEGPPPAPGAAPAVLTCGCLCGKVAFTVPGPAGLLTACHCTQCRKTSGTFAASFEVPSLTPVRGTPAQHRSPGGGVRAFCGTCGSRLWFKAGDGTLSVEGGAVIGPTGGRLSEHIFVPPDSPLLPDDGLPRFAGWGNT